MEAQDPKEATIRVAIGWAQDRINDVLSGDHNRDQKH